MRKNTKISTNTEAALKVLELKRNVYSSLLQAAKTNFIRINDPFNEQKKPIIELFKRQNHAPALSAQNVINDHINGLLQLLPSADRKELITEFVANLKNTFIGDAPPPIKTVAEHVSATAHQPSKVSAPTTSVAQSFAKTVDTSKPEQKTDRPAGPLRQKAQNLLTPSQG
jgi:hypothetical protein